MMINHIVRRVPFASDEQRLTGRTDAERRGLVAGRVPDRCRHRRVQPPTTAPIATAALYNTMSKALPSRDTDTHERIRHDRTDKTGSVTLHVAGKLRHIGIGRIHSRTPIRAGRESAMP